MPSVYPGGLDDFGAEPTPTSPRNSPSLSGIVSHLMEAVHNIEVALGINVEGASSVANRLSALETAIATFLPTGLMQPWPGISVPSGWSLCDGSAVSRTTFAALYTALGGASSPWGQGDGSTTFNLPDMRGKAPKGINSAITAYNAVGKIGGSSTVTIAGNNLPRHGHAATDLGHGHGVSDPQHSHVGPGYDFAVGSIPTSTLFLNVGANIDHGSSNNVSFSPATANAATGVTVNGGNANISVPTAYGNGSGAADPITVDSPFAIVQYIIKMT